MKSKRYLNCSSFSRRASAILAASAALAFASAQAGTLVFSSAVPTFDGDDITQLQATGTFATASGGSNNDNANYVAFDRPTQGQSFTIATAGSIQSLTLRLSPSGFDIRDFAPITVRLNTIAGTTLSTLATETATIGTFGAQPRNPGDYITFSFASPVAVSPGTYGFDFGETVQSYFQIDGALNTSYAGGSAYSSGPIISGDKGNGVGDATATLRDTDRTFGVAFTAVPEPSSFALVLVGSLGLVGMRRRL